MAEKPILFSGSMVRALLDGVKTQTRRVVKHNPFHGEPDWERAWVDGKKSRLCDGGESGPGARPMHPDWARAVRDQCTAAGVPFFFKQHGEWMPIFTGIDPSRNDPRCRIHDGFTFPRKEGEKIGQHMWRVGKKAAGRELDGRVWDERPEVLR